VSRWAYKTDTVTVGSNTQKVRQMTAGERKQFAEFSRAVKDGKAVSNDLPVLIASFGCVDPTVTKEELADMPTDLLDAVVSKIMELTGFKDDDEKKAPTPSALTPSPTESPNA
jgi:hypothetical protein